MQQPVQQALSQGVSKLETFFFTFVILLVLPPFVIYWVLATRFRHQVLDLFPFLKGHVFQAVFLLWCFVFGMTLFPRLVTSMLRP